jgi:hypothetical protein
MAKAGRQIHDAGSTILACRGDIAVLEQEKEDQQFLGRRRLETGRGSTHFYNRAGRLLA